MAFDQETMVPAPSQSPRPKLHNWFIEEREYQRQEQRRGRRYAFERVVPKRTALVVIDMVPFFVRESGYCQGIAPNIVRLADALRIAGGMVTWVVPGSAHFNSDLALEFLGPDVAELFRTSGGAGPIPERIWPDLCPGENDLYFEKLSYSAFFPGSSELLTEIRCREIDTVLIAGTVTNICCESSARDAYACGLRVIVIADGTAARRDQDHNAALHNIYRTFGDVRSTDDAITLLNS
jgi:nicotinamidase-related amidase